MSTSICDVKRHCDGSTELRRFVRRSSEFLRKSPIITNEKTELLGYLKKFYSNACVSHVYTHAGAHTHAHIATPASYASVYVVYTIERTNGRTVELVCEKSFHVGGGRMPTFLPTKITNHMRLYL